MLLLVHMKISAVVSNPCWLLSSDFLTQAQIFIRICLGLGFAIVSRLEFLVRLYSRL